MTLSLSHTPSISSKHSTHEYECTNAYTTASLSDVRYAHLSAIQAQVQSARAPGFVTKTQEADSSEMLAAHKAALRARAAAHGASRPVLLSKMEGSLSGASMQDPAAMGKTLSLVSLSLNPKP
jgi:hypothetical protein